MDGPERGGRRDHATQTARPAKSPEADESAGLSGSPCQGERGANHTDGQGQDDQRADVANSGGPVGHQGGQWRQGFGQGAGQGVGH